VDACAAALDKTVTSLGAADATPLSGPARPSDGGGLGGHRAKIERPDPRAARWPSFAESMSAAGLGGAVEKGSLSTRRAYGAALRTAGELLPQLVCLDADVSNSTFSEMFARAHPKRFFECKIAEQNMVSTAVGLSAAGMIPFVNSFAKFIARAYDQVELASISRANVKLVGSHSGISLAADGPSQMALPDVAFFRSFTSVRGDDGRTPMCRVYLPSDSVSA
jgi:transketolase